MIKNILPMRRIPVFLLTCFLFTSGNIYSQDHLWSLEECINYAIDNNISIKQQFIQTKFQKNALELSKLKLLPTINGQASHNYSFGRALDETTYEFTEEHNVQSNNFYLGGSFNLFSGLQNFNSIQKNKYSLLASNEDLRNIKDNIALTIALEYLQILLNKELVKATANQLDVTRQQIEKTRKLVDAGSVARGNLLQIEAQAAQEELQLINIGNQLDISILNLTQLLELKTAEEFDIVVPEIFIDTNTIITGNVDEIFNLALQIRPEVKSSEYKLAASEYDLRVAQGGRSPRLIMNHSFSTGYSNIRKRLLGIDLETSTPIYGKYSFADQINDNINYGIGLSLNIPILNNWQVNKNISNSKLIIDNYMFELEDTKKQLYKDIQQAFADATAALKKYNASLKAVASSEESFRYTEQKFDVGMITPLDYNAAKTQLLKAQSDMAQSKYEFIFKTKVLDFYKGFPLNLDKL